MVLRSEQWHKETPLPEQAPTTSLLCAGFDKSMPPAVPEGIVYIRYGLETAVLPGSGDCKARSGLLY